MSRVCSWCGQRGGFGEMSNCRGGGFHHFVDTLDTPSGGFGDGAAMNTQKGPWEICRCCGHPRPHMHDENGGIVAGGGAGAGGHPGPYAGTNGGGIGRSLTAEKLTYYPEPTNPEPVILRLNLEIDVDDLTLIEFQAMTDAIKQACNLRRKRLVVMRQPKEVAAPHEEAQREARREILASLDRCIAQADDAYDSKNMLAACREYLAAEEAVEAP
jgi:hypothetical protein